MNAAPNPEIVSRLLNLDLDSVVIGSDSIDFVPGGLRRKDGSPATPEDVEAFKRARKCDWQAACDMHRHHLEQLTYELDRQERIAALVEKYCRADEGDDLRLSEIAARMTPEDRAEWDRLWDDLGGFMLITGEG